MKTAKRMLRMKSRQRTQFLQKVNGLRLMIFIMETDPKTELSGLLEKVTPVFSGDLLLLQ